MISKLESSKNLFGKIVDCMECPICKAGLDKEGNSIKCENFHTFNISKKGTVVLQSKSKLYASSLYTTDLFKNRRQFISYGLYDSVYDKIVSYIKPIITNNSTILDLGSGEASHLKNIMSKLEAKCVGVALDISKPAIELASDFVYNNILPVVADTNNLCFKDNSVSVVLDFLSPLMIKETLRVLKKGGMLVKVIPNTDYLKEVRTLINEKDYTKTAEVLNNIQQKVRVDKVISVKDVFNIDEDIKKALLKMTPLTKNKNLETTNLSSFNQITIDLLVLIIKK